MKEINLEIRELYAFISGYYLGICLRKINDMYSLSKEELIDLKKQIIKK